MTTLPIDNAAVAGALADNASSGALRMIKSFVAKAKTTLGNREAVSLQATKVRVLSRSFFNPREFSKPPSRTEGLRRLQTNILHYKALYGIIFFTLLVYTVLSSPTLLLGVCLVVGMWLYSFVLISPDTPLNACGFELKRREKLVALVPVSLLVVGFTGMISSLFWVFFLASLLSVPHAVCHEVGELDALDALELEGLSAEGVIPGQLP
mmetsp:Transcript_26089/g.69616  ORF Transcript_26089/g.69616 Transcript_26089/m.69616 type:complete len:209 (+) Transcript_26089:55-681(+)